MNLFSQNSVHFVTPACPYWLLFKGTQMFFTVSREVNAQTCKAIKKEDGILYLVLWLELKYQNKYWFDWNNYIIEDWYPAYIVPLV